MNLIIPLPTQGVKLWGKLASGPMVRFSAWTCEQTPEQILAIHTFGMADQSYVTSCWRLHKDDVLSLNADLSV